MSKRGPNSARRIRARPAQAHRQLTPGGPGPKPHIAKACIRRPQVPSLARLSPRGAKPIPPKSAWLDPRTPSRLSSSSASRQLAGTLESGFAAAAAETRDLKVMMQTLAQKIEAPPETARERAMEALERDIAMIAERLAGADKGFAAMAALEQSIGRLLEEMRQVRRTASDATEAAPRLGSEAHERRMAREVAELRAARDEADDRIHLALNAVQETVGKVADRLARIEAEPGAARPARAAAATAGRRPERETAKGAARAGSIGDAAAVLKRPPFDVDGATGVAGGEIDALLIEPGAGFPPRAPKPRAPGAALALADAGDPSEKGGGVNSTGARGAAWAAPAANGRGAGKGGVKALLPLARRTLMLALAALALAVGVYALASSGALKGFEPPRFLKSLGLDAVGVAPLERRSVVAGISQFIPSGVKRKPGTDANLPPRETDPPPRTDSALFDPSAFESAPETATPARPARANAGPISRAIAGGSPIMSGEIEPPPRHVARRIN